MKFTSPEYSSPWFAHVNIKQPPYPCIWINGANYDIINYMTFCFNLNQHKRTLEQLSSISAEKEELSQRCHELDEQVKMLYTWYN